MAADEGWLKMGNGSGSYKKPTFINYTIDDNWNPDIAHYTGGGHRGYDLNMAWIAIDFKQIRFDTEEEARLAYLFMRAAQRAGTLTISIIRKKVGTLEKLDYVNTVFPVMSRGPKKRQKIGPEDSEVYEWGSIRFEQTSAAS